MAQRKFVIWAPSFDETIGGTIVLHYLCNKLNELGCQASIWPGGLWQETRAYKDNILFNNRIMIQVYRIRNSIKNRMRFQLNNKMISPIAKRKDLKDSIIIYPEIVSGNPLSSRHVVRWFLHQPGFHTGEVKYGDGELYFYFHKQFNDPSINPDSTSQLKLRWIRDDIYYQTNFGERRGSCYLLRKGRYRDDITIPEGSINIEEFNHQKKSDIFNKVKYLYSFDQYTMYSAYAAMCGCIPIVVPLEGIAKEDWRPVEADRFGIAYGIDDERWAVETKDKMIAKFQQDKLDETQVLEDFITKCEKYFS